MFISVDRILRINFIAKIYSISGRSPIMKSNSIATTIDDQTVVDDVENDAADSLPNKSNSSKSSRHRPLLIPYMPRRIIVYNFLRRPKNFHAIMYHVSLIVLIIMALLCFALATVPGTLVAYDSMMNNRLKHLYRIYQIDTSWPNHN